MLRTIGSGGFFRIQLQEVTLNNTMQYTSNRMGVGIPLVENDMCELAIWRMNRMHTGWHCTQPTRQDKFTGLILYSMDEVIEQ